MSLIYKNEVYDIIGACFDVYKELSCGLSEPIYQEALEIEFNLRGIPFEREKELVVYYKGRKLRKKYIADFVCYDDIIVELKALDNVTPQVEVKSRRIGGATFQVPTEIRPDRKESISMKNLILFARKRGGKSMADKLAAEIMDAFNEQGGAFKRKEDMHRMAEANRAFAHFRF